MQGIYTLLIELSQSCNIAIGRRGDYSFQSGYYTYVGSALNGLERRIGRHLRREKKLHWHIDYLLRYAEVRGAVYAETGNKQECRIAQELLKSLEPVPGFGCSDCRCVSHLFYHDNPDVLRQAAIAGFRSADLVPVEDVH